MAARSFTISLLKKINIEGKKVVSVLLEDGTTVTGDEFICTADTSILFGKLIDSKYMPKVMRNAYDNSKAFPATSGFQVAFAADKKFNPGETVFIDIEPVKAGASSFDRMYVKVYGYDDAFVNGDRQVIQTNLFQSDEDYKWWKSLSSEEYRQAKEELVNNVQARIEAAFPEIKGNLEYLDAWTPLTYERYCNAYHGSYMSFITTAGTKSIRIKGNIKGIKNLVFAGQWNSQPGGLPVAVTSGKFAIQRMFSKKEFEEKINDQRRTEGREKESYTYDSTSAVCGKRVS